MADTASYRMTDNFSIPGNVIEPKAGDLTTPVTIDDVLELPAEYGEHLVSLRIAERRGVDDADDEGEAVGETSELSKMTVDSLKALAAEREIDLGEATLKADIVKAIEAA